jgi:hypothetical protein
MLVIRDAQMEALQKASLRNLESRLMEHVASHFNQTAASPGESLREPVQHSMQRARSYGFDAPREMCKFLNLQFKFGRDFDRDPLCSWAHGLLRGSLPGVAKMERLYKIALEREAEGRGYFTLSEVEEGENGQSASR